MEGRGPHSKAPPVTRESLVLWRRRQRQEFVRKGLSGREVHVQLAALERHLREIDRRLHEVYRSPDLGNWQDPNDEFVYIVLSRKTSERAYVRAFEELKKLGSWSYVASLDEDDICQVIHGCGLEMKKSTAILEGFRKILQRFGQPDLSRATILDDKELLAFLSSLPEIGPKSALCIMLYSFGRAVFPVDAHVGRTLSRLGSFCQTGLDLKALDHKGRQLQLLDRVPPDCRYSLHVNLIALGRTCCSAVKPRCRECPLSDLCMHSLSAHDSEVRHSHSDQ